MKVDGKLVGGLVAASAQRPDRGRPRLLKFGCFGPNVSFQ